MVDFPPLPWNVSATSEPLFGRGAVGGSEPGGPVPVRRPVCAFPRTISVLIPARSTAFLVFTSIAPTGRGDVVGGRQPLDLRPDHRPDEAEDNPLRLSRFEEGLTTPPGAFMRGRH